MTAHPDRPAHLRAVPALTERHLHAINRRANPSDLLRTIQRQQAAATTAAERAEQAQAITTALPADQKPGTPLHTVRCDENGIAVAHCICCSMTHYTLWDRVAVELAPSTEDIHIATWACEFDINRPATQLQHILSDTEFDLAAEGGADLPEPDEREAEVLRFVTWLNHASSSPASKGWTRGSGGGDAA